MTEAEEVLKEVIRSNIEKAIQREFSKQWWLDWEKETSTWGETKWTEFSKAMRKVYKEEYESKSNVQPRDTN